MKKRAVICHYHIFKNSGTTFDSLLMQNYGNRHISFDGPFPYFVIQQDQLERIIINNPSVIALSSHQIRLPAPSSLDFVVLPVIFVRHPLLRSRSVYQYLRTTNDGTLASKSTKDLSFDQWINHALRTPKIIGQISNAQVGILSGVYQRNRQTRKTPTGMEFDIDQAIRNIDSVRLLGRTDSFDEDVQRFPAILAQYGIEFKYKKIKPKNVTSSDIHRSIDDRLEQLRLSLSNENYNRLVQANSQDIYLLEHVTKLLNENVIR